MSDLAERRANEPGGELALDMSAARVHDFLCGRGRPYSREMPDATSGG